LEKVPQLKAGLNLSQVQKSLRDFVPISNQTHDQGACCQNHQARREAMYTQCFSSGTFRDQNHRHVTQRDERLNQQNDAE
jgi:hypothetical protein